MMPTGTPKQQGSNDCVVFSMAISACLAFGRDPTKMVICQASLRVQLLRCFEAKVLRQYLENTVETVNAEYRKSGIFCCKNIFVAA